MISYVRLWLAGLIAPPGWQLVQPTSPGAEAAESRDAKQPVIFIG
jgi:hypothetical protein